MHETTWMYFKNITLSERTDAEDSIPYDSIFTKFLEKQTIETQSRKVVPWRESRD